LAISIFLNIFLGVRGWGLGIRDWGLGNRDYGLRIGVRD
jgi:hypothetical protein